MQSVPRFFRPVGFGPRHALTSIFVLSCCFGWQTLANAGMIAIDFGSPPVPNWNSAGGGSNPQVLTDLLDVNGAPTGVDLTYNGAVNANTIIVSFTPNASQIPTDTNSLANIGGALGDASGIMFTFDDLLPEHALPRVGVRCQSVSQHRP